MSRQGNGLPMPKELPELPLCRCGHRWEDHGTMSFQEYCSSCACEGFKTSLRRLMQWGDANAMLRSTDALDRP